MKRTYIKPKADTFRLKNEALMQQASLNALTSNPDSIVTPDETPYEDEFTSKGSFNLWDDGEEDIDY